jgi:hypothetical protein
VSSPWSGAEEEMRSGWFTSSQPDHNHVEARTVVPAAEHVCDGQDPHTLVAELHAHTTWSDGEFSIPELVELYGHAGFALRPVAHQLLGGPTRRPDPPV